jgi:hypothetical protein
MREVLLCRKCVSIEVLIEVWGVGVGVGGQRGERSVDDDRGDR